MRRRDIILGAIATGAAGRAEAQSADVKCVIVGDARIGKTCALSMFARNTFPSAYAPTIGAITYTADTSFDGRRIRVTAWDTPGSEDYDRLRPLSYPQTDVFIAAFDLSSTTSYDNIGAKWRPEIVHHNPDAKILLAGLKFDLRGEPPIISNGAVEALVRQYRLGGYRECSAVTGAGISDLFAAAAAVGRSGTVEPEVRVLSPQPGRPMRRRRRL